MENKKKGWDLSIVLALVAVMISICTMIISLVETSIMQKQQQSMTESAKASVWPYIESKMNTSLSAEQEIKFDMTVENKGVGPAIINKMEVYYDGKPLEKTIINAVKLHCPDAQPTNLISTSQQNMILSPGEKKTVSGISLVNAEFMDFTKFTEKVDLKYCYENVYGDIWISGDNGPVKSKECK